MGKKKKNLYRPKQEELWAKIQEIKNQYQKNGDLFSQLEGRSYYMPEQQVKLLCEQLTQAWKEDLDLLPSDERDVMQEQFSDFMAEIMECCILVAEPAQKYMTEVSIEDVTKLSDDAVNFLLSLDDWMFLMIGQLFLAGYHSSAFVSFYEQHRETAEAILESLQKAKYFFQLEEGIQAAQWENVLNHDDVVEWIDKITNASRYYQSHVVSMLFEFVASKKVTTLYPFIDRILAIRNETRVMEVCSLLWNGHHRETEILEGMIDRLLEAEHSYQAEAGYVAMYELVKNKHICFSQCQSLSTTDRPIYFEHLNFDDERKGIEEDFKVVEPFYLDRSTLWRFIDIVVHAPSEDKAKFASFTVEHVRMLGIDFVMSLNSFMVETDLSSAEIYKFINKLQPYCWDWNWSTEEERVQALASLQKKLGYKNGTIQEIDVRVFLYSRAARYDYVHDIYRRFYQEKEFMEKMINSLINAQEDYQAKAGYCIVKYLIWQKKLDCFDRNTLWNIVDSVTHTLSKRKIEFANEVVLAVQKLGVDFTMSLFSFAMGSDTSDDEISQLMHYLDAYNQKYETRTEEERAQSLATFQKNVGYENQAIEKIKIKRLPPPHPPQNRTGW